MDEYLIKILRLGSSTCLVRINYSYFHIDNYPHLFQLTFDTFTVGKFVSFTSDGCPDGHMTIVERSPSPPTGQWCGSAWGYTVYFSESDSINLTLRLDRLSQQVNIFILIC